MSRSRLLVLASAAATLLAAGSSFAADGSLGGTSTGSAAISLDVPDMVQISSVPDLPFGTLTATQISNGADLSGEVCVYSNVGADREYTVTASGSGADGAFTLSDGTANLIAFTVSFSDSVGGTGTGLSAGAESAAFSAAGASAIDCGGADNASFAVTIDPSELQQAAAGTYSGTLTLLVSPATVGGA